MRRMVRKQIYIEPEQDKLLKQRARELGISHAELIRRGIDQVARVPAVFPLEMPNGGGRLHSSSPSVLAETARWRFLNPSAATFDPVLLPVQRQP